jgi:hypothetical protein
VHDAKDEDHRILVDDVVHDPVVSDPKSVERVADTPDGLDGLAADASLVRSVTRQPLERAPNPCPDLIRQLLESSDRGWCQLDPIGVQPKPFRLVVRPLV